MSKDLEKELTETNIDWHLQELVVLVNSLEAGYKMPLTLNVKGNLVAGTLCSGKHYFKEMKRFYLTYYEKIVEQSLTTHELSNVDPNKYNNFANNVSDNLTGGGINTYKNIIKHNYSNYDVLSAKKPAYIHLEYAVNFVPGVPYDVRHGMPWRGKLSSVDSFQFGIISSN